MGVLFPTQISYKVHGQGKRINGIYEPGIMTTLTFLGSVQPLTGKDIESLPGNREDTGSVKIYSDRVLPVSTQGNETEPGAIVLWDNKEWEVTHELTYQNNVISHYKYIGELRE